MISPLKQTIHFSGAPPGEEQPDEAGLELVPRDEVQFFIWHFFLFWPGSCGGSTSMTTRSDRWENTIQ